MQGRIAERENIFVLEKVKRVDVRGAVASRAQSRYSEGARCWGAVRAPNGSACEKSVSERTVVLLGIHSNSLFPVTTVRPSSPLGALLRRSKIHQRYHPNPEDRLPPKCTEREYAQLGKLTA